MIVVITPIRDKVLEPIRDSNTVHHKGCRLLSIEIGVGVSVPIVHLCESVVARRLVIPPGCHDLWRLLGGQHG